MRNIKISAITILFSALLYYLHKLALDNHLYMQFWFYDIMMHFLGGVCVALLLYCVAVFFNCRFLLNKLSQIIILTFIIGVFWELFEVYYKIAGHPLNSWAYKLDTTKDLIMDTLGSVLVWIIVKNKK